MATETNQETPFQSQRAECCPLGINEGRFYAIRAGANGGDRSLLRPVHGRSFL
jgi:hypothetical protein